MTEVLVGVAGSYDETAAAAAIPGQGEMWTEDDVIRENAADTETIRRLKAAIKYRQLLNQLEVFHEARDTIHALLDTAAQDKDESVELPRLMATHAANDQRYAADTHELMEMAEARVIENLTRAAAIGREYKTSPLEVLQARFYASYREKIGADNISPDETI